MGIAAELLKEALENKEACANAKLSDDIQYYRGRYSAMLEAYAMVTGRSWNEANTDLQRLSVQLVLNLN